MLIWLCFTFFYVFSAAVSVFSRNKFIRYISRFFLVITAIYFTGFRDGLGQDYANYAYSMSYINILSFLEPIRAILSIVITQTSFSYILFFVFFATITHYLFLSSSYLFSSSFVIILLYLFNPSLFGQSFNVTRQMLSASIFFSAFRYIEEGKKLNYFLCIIVALMSHISSIILIPIYFYARRQISSIVFILLYLFSLSYIFVDSYLLLIISQIMPLKYLNYLLDVEKKKFSILILVYNILWLFCLLRRKEIVKLKYGNAVFNLGFLALFFYNISSVNVIFQRLSLFFLVFLMIEFTYLSKIYKIKGDSRGLLINSLLIFLFFSIFLFGLIGTPIDGLPSRILPLSSIFD